MKQSTLVREGIPSPAVLALGLQAFAVLTVGVVPSNGHAQSADFGGDPTPTSSVTQQPTAVEGALFLLLPVGAQGVAMGRAMTALPSQESAFWNPAGLADIHGNRFLFYTGDQVAGEATAVSFLTGRESVGTLGISYQQLDVGDQNLTSVTGEVLGTISVRSHQGVVSFATDFADRVSAGANFKVVQFRLGCRGQCLDQGVTATTYAVDVGIQSSPFEAIPLRLGVMVAHLGPNLQVVNAEQSDPLPTRMRVSGAYEVLGHFVTPGATDLWLTVELEDRWREPGSPSLYVGTELSTGQTDALFVRAGYVRGDVLQTEVAALGVGLRFQRFDLGIAKSLARTSLTGETEPVHITLGVVF